MMDWNQVKVWMKGVKYKPGWEFSARPVGYGQVEITVRRWARRPDDPSRIEQRTEIAVAEMDEKYLKCVIETVVETVELKEMKQWLSFAEIH